MSCLFIGVRINIKGAISKVVLRNFLKNGFNISSIQLFSLETGFRPVSKVHSILHFCGLLLLDRIQICKRKFSI